MSVTITDRVKKSIYVDFHADSLKEVEKIVKETINRDLWVKSRESGGVCIVEVGPFCDSIYASVFKDEITELLESEK